MGLDCCCDSNGSGEVWQLHIHDELFDGTFLCDWKFCCGVVLVRDGGDSGLFAAGAGNAVFGSTISRSVSMTGSVCIVCSGFCGDTTRSNSPTPDPKFVHCDIYEGRVGRLVWPSTIVSPKSDISEFVREFV
jgi:hypothetical protein